MTTTSAPAPATPSRSRRIIAISLAIIAALVVAFFIFANLYADWQWYAQLGFQFGEVIGQLQQVVVDRRARGVGHEPVHAQAR